MEYGFFLPSAAEIIQEIIILVYFDCNTKPVERPISMLDVGGRVFWTKKKGLADIGLTP